MASFVAFVRWTTRCKTWEKQSRLKTRPSPSRPGKTWGKHGQIMAIFVESSGEWFVKYGNNEVWMILRMD